MILTYELKGKEFEYKIDFSQFSDFIIKKLSKEEILEFVVDTWLTLEDNSKEKKDLESNYDIITKKDWEELIEDDLYIVLDFIGDHEEEFIELYEDDILEYFYDEAITAEKEAREYERDPYSYYGLRRDDFF
jgi:hypothetical protein